jgi:hypothetical protein
MADTTANRGYPYPESTDTIDVPGDIQALADAVDADVEDLGSTTDTNDPGAVQAGFTLWTAGAKGTLALGGKLVQVWLDLNNASALTATGGNLSDTTCYVLDAAYRPDADHYVPFNFQTGAVQGSGQIFPDGTVSLQAATATVPSGSHIRIQAVYLKA